MPHAHEYVDAGPAMTLELIPARCACGATRLELVNPVTRRRTGIALPIDVVKTAAAGKQVVAGAGEILRVGGNILEALRALGLVKT
jgi:hypothetical protein